MYINTNSTRRRSSESSTAGGGGAQGDNSGVLAPLSGVIQAQSTTTSAAGSPSAAPLPLQVPSNPTTTTSQKKGERRRSSVLLPGGGVSRGGSSKLAPVSSSLAANDSGGGVAASSSSSSPSPSMTPSQRGHAAFSRAATAVKAIVRAKGMAMRAVGARGGGGGEGDETAVKRSPSSAPTRRGSSASLRSPSTLSSKSEGRGRRGAPSMASSPSRATRGKEVRKGGGGEDSDGSNGSDDHDAIDPNSKDNAGKNTDDPLHFLALQEKEDAVTRAFDVETVTAMQRQCHVAGSLITAPTALAELMRSRRERRTELQRLNGFDDPRLEAIRAEKVLEEESEKEKLRAAARQRGEGVGDVSASSAATAKEEVVGSAGGGGVVGGGGGGLGMSYMRRLVASVRHVHSAEEAKALDQALPALPIKLTTYASAFSRNVSAGDSVADPVGSNQSLLGVRQEDASGEHPHTRHHTTVLTSVGNAPLPNPIITPTTTSRFLNLVESRAVAATAQRAEEMRLIAAQRRRELEEGSVDATTTTTSTPPLRPTTIAMTDHHHHPLPSSSSVPIPLFSPRYIERIEVSTDGGGGGGGVPAVVVTNPSEMRQQIDEALLNTKRDRVPLPPPPSTTTTAVDVAAVEMAAGAAYRVGGNAIVEEEEEREEKHLQRFVRRALRHGVDLIVPVACDADHDADDGEEDVDVTATTKGKERAPLADKKGSPPSAAGSSSPSLMLTAERIRVRREAHDINRTKGAALCAIADEEEEEEASTTITSTTTMKKASGYNNILTRSARAAARLVGVEDLVSSRPAVDGGISIVVGGGGGGGKSGAAPFSSSTFPSPRRIEGEDEKGDGPHLLPPASSPLLAAPSPLQAQLTRGRGGGGGGGGNNVGSEPLSPPPPPPPSHLPPLPPLNVTAVPSRLVTLADLALRHEVRTVVLPTATVSIGAATASAEGGGGDVNQGSNSDGSAGGISPSTAVVSSSNSSAAAAAVIDPTFGLGVFGTLQPPPLSAAGGGGGGYFTTEQLSILKMIPKPVIGFGAKGGGGVASSGNSNSAAANQQQQQQQLVVNNAFTPLEDTIVLRPAALGVGVGGTAFMNAGLGPGGAVGVATAVGININNTQQAREEGGGGGSNNGGGGPFVRFPETGRLVLDTKEDQQVIRAYQALLQQQEERAQRNAAAAAGNGGGGVNANPTLKSLASFSSSSSSSSPLPTIAVNLASSEPASPNAPSASFPQSAAGGVGVGGGGQRYITTSQAMKITAAYRALVARQKERQQHELSKHFLSQASPQPTSNPQSSPSLSSTADRQPHTQNNAPTTSHGGSSGGGGAAAAAVSGVGGNSNSSAATATSGGGGGEGSVGAVVPMDPFACLRQYHEHALLVDATLASLKKDVAMSVAAQQLHLECERRKQTSVVRPMEGVTTLLYFPSPADSAANTILACASSAKKKNAKNDAKKKEEGKQQKKAKGEGKQQKKAKGEGKQKANEANRNSNNSTDASSSAACKAAMAALLEERGRRLQACVRQTVFNFHFRMLDSADDGGGSGVGKAKKSRKGKALLTLPAPLNATGFNTNLMPITALPASILGGSGGVGASLGGDERMASSSSPMSMMAMARGQPPPPSPASAAMPSPSDSSSSPLRMTSRRDSLAGGEGGGVGGGAAAASAGTVKTSLLPFATASRGVSPVLDYVCGRHAGGLFESSFAAFTSIFESEDFITPRMLRDTLSHKVGCGILEPFKVRHIMLAICPPREALLLRRVRSAQNEYKEEAMAVCKQLVGGRGSSGSSGGLAVAEALTAQQRPSVTSPLLSSSPSIMSKQRSEVVAVAEEHGCDNNSEKKQGEAHHNSSSRGERHTAAAAAAAAHCHDEGGGSPPLLAPPPPPPQLPPATTAATLLTLTSSCVAASRLPPAPSIRPHSPPMLTTPPPATAISVDEYNDEQWAVDGYSTSSVFDDDDDNDDDDEEGTTVDAIVRMARRRRTRDGSRSSDGNTTFYCSHARARNDPFFVRLPPLDKEAMLKEAFGVDAVDAANNKSGLTSPVVKGNAGAPSSPSKTTTAMAAASSAAASSCSLAIAPPPVGGRGGLVGTTAISKRDAGKKRQQEEAETIRLWWERAEWLHRLREAAINTRRQRRRRRRRWEAVVRKRNQQEEGGALANAALQLSSVSTTMAGNIGSSSSGIGGGLLMTPYSQPITRDDAAFASRLFDNIVEKAASRATTAKARTSSVTGRGTSALNTINTNTTPFVPLTAAAARRDVLKALLLSPTAAVCEELRLRAMAVAGLGVRCKWWVAAGEGGGGEGGGGDQHTSSSKGGGESDAGAPSRRVLPPFASLPSSVVSDLQIDSFRLTKRWIPHTSAALLKTKTLASSAADAIILNNKEEGATKKQKKLVREERDGAWREGICCDDDDVRSLCAAFQIEHAKKKPPPPASASLSSFPQQAMAAGGEPWMKEWWYSTNGDEEELSLPPQAQRQQQPPAASPRNGVPNSRNSKNSVEVAADPFLHLPVQSWLDTPFPVQAVKQHVGALLEAVLQSQLSFAVYEFFLPSAVADLRRSHLKNVLFGVLPSSETWVPPPITDESIAALLSELEGSLPLPEARIRLAKLFRDVFHVFIKRQLSKGDGGGGRDANSSVSESGGGGGGGFVLDQRGADGGRFCPSVIYGGGGGGGGSGNGGGDGADAAVIDFLFSIRSNETNPPRARPTEWVRAKGDQPGTSKTVAGSPSASAAAGRGGFAPAVTERLVRLTHSQQQHEPLSSQPSSFSSLTKKGDGSRRCVGVVGGLPLGLKEPSGNETDVSLYRVFKGLISSRDPSISEQLERCQRVAGYGSDDSRSLSLGISVPLSMGGAIGGGGVERGDGRDAVGEEVAAEDLAEALAREEAAERRWRAGTCGGGVNAWSSPQTTSSYDEAAGGCSPTAPQRCEDLSFSAAGGDDGRVANSNRKQEEEDSLSNRAPSHTASTSKTFSTTTTAMGDGKKGGALYFEVFMALLQTSSPFSLFCLGPILAVAPPAIPR